MFQCLFLIHVFHRAAVSTAKSKNLLLSTPDSVWTPAQQPPGQFRLDTLWQANMTMEATQFSYIVGYVYKWSMFLCHVCVAVGQRFVALFPCCVSDVISSIKVLKSRGTKQQTTILPWMYEYAYRYHNKGKCMFPINANTWDSILANLLKIQMQIEDYFWGLPFQTTL